MGIANAVAKHPSVLTTPTGVQNSKISNRLISNQQSNHRTNGLLIDEQGLLIAEVTRAAAGGHLNKQGLFSDARSCGPGFTELLTVQALMLTH